VIQDGVHTADAWATDSAACARMFAEFARSARPRAPLYARLATGIAADPELAGLLLLSPPRQRQPVLLLACIHALLLEARYGELARFYPNLTARPAEGDPLPALRRFIDRHADRLAELLASRSTQTNEIGRCALLLPVFGLLAVEVGSLAHVDVGASAGLNLLLDRYHYTYVPGGSLGGPSPIELECGTRGAVPVPVTMPDVRQRVGLDRSPVDVGDPASRRWLEACVWPDQTDRFRRLRAALALAAEERLDVRQGDAVADTAALAASLESHPVVTNTWVLNYLSSVERCAFVDNLEELGSRRDVSWVFAESPMLVPELPVSDRTQAQTALVLVRWRVGHRTVTHLGDAHPHGYWLHWR
jgi:hypothetical protein